MQTEFFDCTDICRSTLQYLTNIFILSLIFKLKILIYIILLFLADIVALEYIIENIRNHSAIELQRREKLRGKVLHFYVWASSVTVIKIKKNYSMKFTCLI